MWLSRPAAPRPGAGERRTAPRTSPISRGWC